MAVDREWATGCTVYGMRRYWISVTVLTAMAFATLLAAPANVDLSRAEGLYRRTEYDRAISAVQSLGGKDAASCALLGKAYFMEGQYRQAIANLETAVALDSSNSDYYDWLGRAYGRLAEGSSFTTAFVYARRTVRAFERAVELGPSNLEASSDLFEYYLEAPGVVGGGVAKAETIARRIGSLDVAEGHWTRARLAEKRKDFAAAERELRAAMQVAPGQLGRTLDLAAFLSSRGRYGESDALFGVAEETHPNSPRVLYARAAAYVHSKRRLDEAQTLLEKYLALQTTPDDPTRQEAMALMRSARNSHPKSCSAGQSGSRL